MKYFVFIPVKLPDVSCPVKNFACAVCPDNVFEYIYGSKTKAMKTVRITDIETLVKARFDYFSNDPLVPAGDHTLIEDSMRRYFSEHAGTDDFVAIAVMEGGDIAAIGFMTVGVMPASGSVPNGRLGTLLNILTYPEFRGKGYGKVLIQALIDEARALGLSVIDLHATEQGAGLYARMGFEPLPYKAMRLRLLK